MAQQGIIDILVLDNPPSFTVNLAAQEVLVNVNFPVVPDGAVSDFENAPSLTQFQPRDNFNILTMGIRLPHCFTIGTGIPLIGLQWNQGPGQKSPMVPITGGVASAIWVPEPDIEIPLDIFIPYDPIDPTAQTTVNLMSIDLNVSMIGVPAALDTIVFEVQVFLKILHNIPLQ